MFKKISVIYNTTCTGNTGYGSDIVERCGTIYAIENITNGKYYVGQTSRKLEERLTQHRSEAFNHISMLPFPCDSRKYRWEQFSIRH